MPGQSFPKLGSSISGQSSQMQLEALEGSDAFQQGGRGLPSSSAATVSTTVTLGSGHVHGIAHSASHVMGQCSMATSLNIMNVQTAASSAASSSTHAASARPQISETPTRTTTAR
jgi:hypothetical protein